MNAFRWILPPAVTALLLLAPGCGPRRPNVLFISIDSLRHDEVGAVREGKQVTPRLSALARESLVFDRATSAAPWTTPSVMAMMTGLPAAAHGVLRHDRCLASSVPTLAERFREAGYRTAGFAPAVTLRPEYGFGRGFEVYDYEQYGHDRVSSPELAGKVIHRIEAWKDEPFFAWVHLWDPHYNYNPPPPWNAAFRRGTKPRSTRINCLKWVPDPVTREEADWLRGQYEGEILYTDRYVGEMLDALERLGLRDRTIVVVVADHGEAFLEHHWLGHTNRVDETLVHVPLLLRAPGVAPGRIEVRVSTTRIGATLLRLAGIDPAGFGMEPPLPLDPARARGVPALAETERRGCFTALVGDRYKLVVDHRTCRPALYDLEEDPGETRDLAGEQPGRVAGMMRTLRERMEEIRRRGVPRAMLPREIVEEAEARLRSIGYMQGRTPGDGNTGVNRVVCDGVVLEGPRDAFGDVQAAPPCPPDGVFSCLGPLHAPEHRSPGEK